jgi:hypothetical protein
MKLSELKNKLEQMDVHKSTLVKDFLSVLKQSLKGYSKKVKERLYSELWGFLSSTTEHEREKAAAILQSHYNRLNFIAKGFFITAIAGLATVGAMGILAASLLAAGIAFSPLLIPIMGIIGAFLFFAGAMSGGITLPAQNGAEEKLYDLPKSPLAIKFFSPTSSAVAASETVTPELSL